eukprot:COSAG02_NODE_1125_length_14435_cov_97.039411_2_plen_79_part_00
MSGCGRARAVAGARRVRSASAVADSYRAVVRRVVPRIPAARIPQTSKLSRANEVVLDQNAFWLSGQFRMQNSKPTAIL